MEQGVWLQSGWAQDRVQIAIREKLNMYKYKWWFPKIRDTLFEAHYSILGSTLGSPYFGKLPNEGRFFWRAHQSPGSSCSSTRCGVSGVEVLPGVLWGL